MGEDVNKELSVDEAQTMLGHNDGKTDKDGMTPPAAPASRPPAEEKTGEEAKDDKPADDKPDADGDTGKDAPEDGEEKDTSLEEEQTEDWGSTGDETGDAVLTMLQDAKVTQAEAEAMLFEAVKSNDPSKINRELLVEKVGEAQATLIINSSTAFMKANAAKVTEITKSIHDTAGGKENWDKVADWSKSNMTDAERGEYAEMIDQGGLKAKFAAEQMVKAFEGDSKNSSLSTAGDVHVGESSAAPAARAISRAEMVKELDVLHNRTNLPYAEKMQKDRAIRAARKAGAAQGL